MHAAARALLPAILVSSLSAGLLLAREDWDLAPPAPAVAIQPSEPQGLEGLGCGACHGAIAQEWASSAHALAWVDRAYQEELLDKKRPELCFGCHVPRPVLEAGVAARPAAREDGRGLGVTCESCHRGPDGAIHGPFGSPTEAHPSVQDALFVGAGSSALCSACHSTNIGPVIGVAKDFEAARLGEQGFSCVGCHLERMERSVATLTAGGASAPERSGRSHALQTPRDPAFLARAFEASVHAAEGATTLQIHNRAGHRVPGLIGREIAFTAELLDASGAVVARGELLIDQRAYLPVGDSRSIALDGSGTEVHLVGMHLDPRSETPIRFLELSLDASGR